MIAPPPTPNSPLNSPPREPIAPSSGGIRRARHARHTRAVSAAATITEAIAPLRADPERAAVLLDIDGVLAPIVRHADDAHVPEPTRVRLDRRSPSATASSPA